MTFLGFLTTMDDSARGNYGLMDQVAALHWIQENIKQFGGDASNITVFGHGTGANCVHLLMISPVAKGNVLNITQFQARCQLLNTSVTVNVLNLY